MQTVGSVPTPRKDIKVVLRQHANCRLCSYAKEGNKVVSRQHANCRLCSYARKSCVTTRKSSRLKKPDNRNLTSEASKEAKPKRTEGKWNYNRKQTKELKQGYK
jgi:hypothetical protein